jgi:(2Fe-2S) ferredoxin
VCQGTGCESSSSNKIRERLLKSIQENNLADEINVKPTGCHGFCQKGPIVVIEPEGTFYTNVKEKDASSIIYQHFVEKKLLINLLYKDPITSDYIQKYKDIPFYKNQKRIVLRNCGHINPEEIDEYINIDGYSALQKVLFNLSPKEVIEEIIKSRLRGRGGAGFPTGIKWKFCLEAKGEPKYIICNADEGDPGAFMDRWSFYGQEYS